MDSETVLFGPDRNLAHYAKNFTNKRVIPIPEFGFCPVHVLFNKNAILKLKRAHPDAEVLAHPECNPEVCRVADFVGSTSRMYKQALVSSARKFIVATEVGLLHRMKKDRGEAVFIPAYEEAVCAHMRLHNLEKLYQTLRHERYEVKVLPKIATRAKNAVDVMLGTRETLA